MQLPRVIIVVLATLGVLSTVSAEQDDPYTVLGVPRDATVHDIRRRFRKAALHHHPDRNKGPTAEADFIKIAAAYELLTDKDARARYDASSAGWKAHESRPTDFAQHFDMHKFYDDFDRELKLHFEAIKKQQNQHLYALDPKLVEAHAEHLDTHMKAHLKAVRQMRQDMEAEFDDATGKMIDVADLFADFADPRFAREVDNL